MLGTFSGGGLGMGVAFRLNDEFSRTAEEIQRKMGQLGAYTDVMAKKINKSMDLMKFGAVTAMAGGLILAPFIKGIGAASDLEENINKVDVAFGNYAGRIKEFSNTATDNFGISKSKALEMAGLFGDMATGMGMAQEKASGMSEKMVALVGDLASFKNISHDRAMNALTGVFTGVGKSLLGLGIVMKQPQLEEFALTKGSKDFGDMNDAEKAQIRFQFVMERSKNAIGDYLRTADGYANSKRSMSEWSNNVSTSFGNILMPLVSKAMQLTTSFLKVLDKFANSKVGKVILSIVAALGMFLVVAGISMMVTGGLRFAVFKMAGAFGDATKATIIQTIATKGATAGLRQMAVAAWASLGPYLIIGAAIAVFVYALKKGVDMMQKGTETSMRWGAVILGLLGPIGWVAAAIIGISKGFDKFNKWDGVEKTGGIIGFFMKVAGVLMAVKQMWTSFNGDTFTLTKTMADKLEALGILDIVIEIGTWLARLKTIWLGIVNGFKIGFTILKGYFSEIWTILKESFGGIPKSFKRIKDAVYKAFGPIIDIFNKITNGIFQSKGELSGWQQVAKVIGTVIMSVFEALGFTLKWVIQLIVWVIEGIIYAISKIAEVIYWAIGWIVKGFILVGDTVAGIIDFLFGLVGGLWDVGVSFMQSLWGGFKSIFPAMGEWLETVVASLFAKLKAPFKWIANKLGKAWGGQADMYDKGVQGIENADRVEQAKQTEEDIKGTHHKTTSKNPKQKVEYTPREDYGAGNTYVMLTTLDGKEISKKVVTELEMKANRRNG